MLLILTFITSCCANNTNDRVSIIQSIITATYKPYLCMYIIVDYGSAGDVISASRSMNVPVILQEYLDVEQKSVVCEEYNVQIVISANVTHLEQLLTKDNKKIITFPSFSSIITFLSYDISTVRNLFQNAYNSYAVQVVSAKYSTMNNRLYLWINNSAMYIDNVELLNENIFFDTWNISSIVETNLLVIQNYTNRSVYDMKNKILRVSGFNCTPFLVSLGDKYCGIEYTVLKHAAQGMQLDMVFYMKNRTSMWSVVSKDLKEGTSDLMLCTNWLDIINYKSFTLSIPYTQMCISFLAPNPVFLYALYVFSPLDITVWLYLSLVTIILMFVLYLCALVYRKLYSIYPRRYVHFMNCVDDIFRILLQVPMNEFPTQMLLRCIMLLWIVTSMMIIAGYTGGITSFLTRPQYTKPINTLQDFIESGSHWGFSDPSYVNTMMHTAESTLYKLGSMFDDNGDDELRKERVKKRNYGLFGKFVSNTLMIDGDIYTDKSVLSMLRPLQECMYHYKLVFKMRKNSPFKYVLDKKLYQFLESGLYSHWYKQIYTSLNGTTMDKLFTGFETYFDQSSLSVRRIQGVFYLLFSGLSLSLTIFIIEVCFKKSDVVVK